MQEVKINYSLNGTEKSLTAIKNNNELSFTDDNIKTQIKTFDDNIIINRETDEYRLELNLKDKIGHVHLKNHGSVTMDIKKVKFSNKNDIIKISYEIDEEVNIVIRSIL